MEDSPLPALLSLLRRRIKEVPNRYRLVVFTGDFTGEEIKELRERAQMLAPRGELEVLVNRAMPLTHNHSTADYYAIEFGISDGQPNSLVQLAKDDSLLTTGSVDMGREELVARLTNGTDTNGTAPAETIKKLLVTRR